VGEKGHHPNKGHETKNWSKSRFLPISGPFLDENAENAKNDPKFKFLDTLKTGVF
jgi:hypothetical protein